MPDTSRERWAKYDEEHPREKKDRPASLEAWAKKTAGKIAPGLVSKALKGGFTTRPFKDKPTPEKGYVVSLPTSSGFNLKFDPKAPPKSRAAINRDIKAFLTKSLIHIVDKPDLHIGGWLGDDHRIHFDVSQVMKSGSPEHHEKALALGRDRDQRAVYRIEDGETFSTGGSGD